MERAARGGLGAAQLVGRRRLPSEHGRGAGGAGRGGRRGGARGPAHDDRDPRVRGRGRGRPGGRARGRLPGGGVGAGAGRRRPGGGDPAGRRPAAPLDPQDARRLRAIPAGGAARARVRVREDAEKLHLREGETGLRRGALCRPRRPLGVGGRRPPPGRHQVHQQADPAAAALEPGHLAGEPAQGGGGQRVRAAPLRCRRWRRRCRRRRQRRCQPPLTARSPPPPGTSKSAWAKPGTPT